MSVEQEAKAAAEAAYPMVITYDVGPSPRPRIPYAQGYQAGYAAALAAPFTPEELDAALAGWRGEWVGSDREAMEAALSGVLALRARRS